MAGMRVEPVVTQRLATMAQSQGARTVGGRMPADPRPPQHTAHIPGRVLPVRQPSGTGLYAPTFSVPGDQSAAYYTMGLDNITGTALTITRLSARLGSPPQGSALRADVYLDDGSSATLVGGVTIPDGGLFGEVAVSMQWAPGTFLTVDVPQVGSVYGGFNLVVQVLTA